MLSSGDDAIWIQERDRGSGFGHSGLIVQDKDGEWYYFFWGASGGNKIEQLLGVDPVCLVVKLDTQNLDMKNPACVVKAISQSDIASIRCRADYVTETIYFEGDYTKTLVGLQTLKARTENEYGPLYYMVDMNCAEVSAYALMLSNSELTQINSVIPNRIVWTIRSLSHYHRPTPSWASFSTTDAWSQKA